MYYVVNLIICLFCEGNEENSHFRSDQKNIRELCTTSISYNKDYKTVNKCVNPTNQEIVGMNDALHLFLTTDIIKLYKNVLTRPTRKLMETHFL